jgi:hypothetical protein
MKTIIIKSIEEAGAHLGNAGRKEWLNTAPGSETPVDIGGYRYILRPTGERDRREPLSGSDLVAMAAGYAPRGCGR